MSKHGGSEASGLVMPAGIEQHQVMPSGIVIPEIARKAAEAKDRALQFERRRLALAVLPEMAKGVENMPMSRFDTDPVDIVARALALADELMAKTGGVV